MNHAQLCFPSEIDADFQVDSLWKVLETPFLLNILSWESSDDIICALGLFWSLTSVKLLNPEHLQVCSTLKEQFYTTGVDGAFG